MTLPPAARSLFAGTIASLVLALPVPAQTSVVDTTHNLSISGPGPYKALSEGEVCIFCHTPHRARTVPPLWNRNDSRETYITYESSTFEGNVTQPTGGSKLCLSCHDGSIALGEVVSLSAEIDMLPGYRHLRSGPGFIGTNLADDHPISFHYASSRGGTEEYTDSRSIPPPVRIDSNGNVECTSCHEPHDNSFGDFLRTSDRYSELCLACHLPLQWQASSHATSPATWTGAPPNPWAHARYHSVAENACASCHRSHGAKQPERLLAFAREEETCLTCHNGNVAATNLEAEFRKPFRHDTFWTEGVHDPTENPLVMARHAECVDCHDPHASREGAAAAPGVPGALFGAAGVSAGGQPVRQIRFGYELCYKCHGDNHGSKIYVPRQIQQANTRLEFLRTNPSFHPIEAPGTNPDVPSLLPPWTTASVMTCTSCHDSESSPEFGGTGPAGPHGSIYAPILGANYDTIDGAPETPKAYELCYKCHSRSSILGDQSFAAHRLHVVDSNTSCAACHDPHGISGSQGNAVNNSNLMNFDISLVEPSPTTGQLSFRDDGFRKGTCMLLCHGVDHAPLSY